MESEVMAAIVERFVLAIERLERRTWWAMAGAVLAWFAGGVAGKIVVALIWGGGG